MAFRIEATTFNPENDGPSTLAGTATAATRNVTRMLCQEFWRNGDWVEVFDEATNELLAGPIDPDRPYPSYTV
ncbi:hypothetical protein [Chromobacterium vaccinii]|uniref:hypothetical protein n=1 Tax=Chromobacterium vaccinii TaxID=1108595 RepID=UPI00345B0CED